MSETTKAQEAYEAVRAYFSRPDAVLARTINVDDESECSYRDGEGNKCAVGCLISDELYDKLVDESRLRLDDYGRIEGIDDELKDRFAKGENGNLKELAGIIGYDDLKRFQFLASAQSAHDMQAKDAPHLVTLLDRIAGEQGLQVVTQ
jgi:hypothetical protein